MMFICEAVYKMLLLNADAEFADLRRLFIENQQGLRGSARCLRCLRSFI